MGNSHLWRLCCWRFVRFQCREKHNRHLPGRHLGTADGSFDKTHTFCWWCEYLTKLKWFFQVILLVTQSHNASTLAVNLRVIRGPRVLCGCWQEYHLPSVIFNTYSVKETMCFSKKISLPHFVLKTPYMNRYGWNKPDMLYRYYMHTASLGKRDGLLSAQVTTSSPSLYARAWCGDEFSPYQWRSTHFYVRIPIWKDTRDGLISAYVS